MKSLLVKIASFAVVVHMTFGCSLHHGLGTNACAHQHTSVCNHNHGSHGHFPSDHNEDHDHQHHDHQHHDPLPDSAPISDVDESSHSSSHLGCCDDGCNATQFVQFEFQALDFSVPYLGGVDTLVLIENQSPAGFHVDPFPDCSHSETGVRAHLLFGVQIL
jgi:hypothetical protein